VPAEPAGGVPPKRTGAVASEPAGGGPPARMGAAPAHVSAFAPGRVNLIGEHTDYNQGLALPFAIAQGIAVHAQASGDERIHARALDLAEEDDFALARPSGAEGWRAFLRGAVAELRRAGFPLVGARLEIGGDLPRGAGLSSSAALEVALCLAMLALAGVRSTAADGTDAGPANAGPADAGPANVGPADAGLADAGLADIDRTDLARLCSRIENDWVGARTGLLDQLASLYGQPHAALRIDFHSLTVEPVPLRLHGGWRLVTLDSGQRHAHAASAYNERRAECARSCELLGVPSLRQASWEDLPRLPQPLRRRAAHVLAENARVEAAVAALRAGDLAGLGPLLNASHASLRDDYEVSTEALENTVRRLLEAGAVGARLIGGGFGGHVLGLLPPGALAPAGGREVHAGPGAHLL
jgi:galactokinase